MRYLELRGAMLRAALVALLIAIPAHLTFAQTQAIEPCQAAPTPQLGRPAAPAKVNAKVSQTVIDSSIPNDPTVQKILASYSAKVNELSVVIGTLDGELKKSGVGAASLGRLVSDAIANAARAKGKSVDLVFTNASGFRKNNIAPGQLRASDIFELLPFENALIEVEVTGAQLLKVLQNLTRARDAQAGARIEFRWNEQDRPEFISAKLIGPDKKELEIDAAATYKIVTVDYLLKVSSGNYALLQEAKNLSPLNITIRDAVMDYVKAETKAGRPIRATLDDRFVQVGPGPRNQTSPND